MRVVLSLQALYGPGRIDYLHLINWYPYGELNPGCQVENLLS